MAPQVKKGKANKAAGKVYTWEEVAQHNTEESCWVYIGSKVYDITSWLDRHPGGKAHLLLAAGRDCTDLFESYHPFTEKARDMLDKYEIGTVSSTEFPQFKPDSGFYRDVTSRVKTYFDESGLDPKDPVPGLARLVGIFLGAWFSFQWMNDTSLPFVFALLAAAVYGMCQALSLLHVMHDASHTSIGRHPTHWRVWGRLTMDWFAGADLTSWHNQHVIGHHVYTNVLGADPDLPVEVKGDMRRVAPKQTWAPLYRFQHYYLLVLYGLLGLKFRFQDIIGIVSKQNGPIRVNVDGNGELVWAVVTKAVWAAWRIYVPLYVWGVPAWHYWTLFAVAELITGYFLAFNFQVSHVSPSAVFPDIAQEEFSDEWAKVQVLTTVDYGHGNTLATFLCGALNYQTVHHLFPSVSQYHYPSIAPIVRAACKDHNVRYTLIPTFAEAFKLHVDHLKEMGVKAIHMD